MGASAGSALLFLLLYKVRLVVGRMVGVWFRGRLELPRLISLAWCI